MWYTCTRWAGAATHAHAHGTATAQGGVEAEKFHVSWDLRSAVSDLSVTLCRVCVLSDRLDRGPLSRPPPGSAHGAHSRAYTQSESLSSMSKCRAGFVL